MASFNKVILAGNLTRDPELRYTPQGDAVTDIGLAVTKRYKDKESTAFVDITFWGKSAETICEYLKKGSNILVEGELITDSWDDRETGKKVYKLKARGISFQFLDKRGGDKQQSNRQSNQQYNTNQNYTDLTTNNSAENDEIPF